MDAVSAINTASEIQMDFMKLLVTQLQNQDPLEPLNNNEMASQLAQFSGLQQLETLNSSFAKVLARIEHTYANSLIGKEVSFVGGDESIDTDVASAVVEQVFNNVDGEVILAAGNSIIGLADILSVKNGNVID